MSESKKNFILELTDSIYRYIDHITKEHGYMISIHGIEGYAMDNWPRLLRYYYHQCPLCREIKTSSTAWAYCTSRQDKVIERAKGGVYIGTCYTGVTECVYPLKDLDGIVCGFLCVSGYTADRVMSRERACAACAKYGLNKQRILQAVDQLNDQLPDMEILDTQISPIQRMLSTLFYFNNLLEPVGDESTPKALLYHQLVAYANEQFRNTDFSLEKTCKALTISYSYASRVFSQFNKLPFSSYVQSVRIETAKRYLEYTDLPISLIAPEVGFSDSNYFSSIFRSLTGVSPTAYRQTHHIR